MAEEDFDPYQLRQATEADLSGLMQLEEMCFTTPWTRAAFLQEMELPHAELWLLFLAGESVPLAYVNFWVAVDEASLLNIAVQPSLQRKGIASRLLRWMENRGRLRGAQSVFLEVRRDNVAGLMLYRRAGYIQVGIRKGYYSSDKQDAVVMRKELVGTVD